MIENISRSLRDMLGDAYIDAVIRVSSALTGEHAAALDDVASEPVEFFPPSFAARSDELARRAGDQLVPPWDDDVAGAATEAFARAQNDAGAPLGGLGVCRIGQDGRIHIAGKSEHYQLSLGHAFPGYRLIDAARRLGIPNATHNNTRGHVTRLLERELVNAAAPDPDLPEPGTTPRLSRVINLETGSLAAEAALTLMLARFWPADGGAPAAGPDRIPVFLVMGDRDGGITGNYHGTTTLAQSLRGLWPGMTERAGAAGLYRVLAVRPNDIADFRATFAEATRDGGAVAGFCHEIVMMNYGGLRLDPDYLRDAYRICHEADVPVFCDEIQSGAWYGELFLFRRYGLHPDLVAIGKGFPGGEYPASRILLSERMDSLAQFGALVTNGQEELASLAYLITMAFVRANTDHIDATGALYHELLGALVSRHSRLLRAVSGDQHMAAIEFFDATDASRFCRELDREHGVDISVQAYKPSAPPAALTKLPMISTAATVEAVLERMEKVLVGMEETR